MFDMGAETLDLPLSEKMKYEQGDNGDSFGCVYLILCFCISIYLLIAQLQGAGYHRHRQERHQRQRRIFEHLTGRRARLALNGPSHLPMDGQ